MVAEDAYLDVMRKDLAHIQVTVTCTDDATYKSLRYERAPLPSKRIQAIEKLQREGFDVQLRLSPYIPELVDIDDLKEVKCDKLLVEFLRVNGWIEKWFAEYKPFIEFDEYTVKQGGYRHLPLRKKIELIEPLTQLFKEVTVCEDEDDAYAYWRDNFNPQSDCCNLRLPSIG